MTTTPTTLQIWLSAFRLRTLPLALASVLAGSFTAMFFESFNLVVALLAVLTTVFLQILSNLANDYGDGMSGADNENRIGPQRTVQSGLIKPEQMKKAILVFTFWALFSGVALIIAGTKGQILSIGVVFFLLGVAAIAAAIKYTVGKNPYGYRGLGDLFVFIFFGPVGVMGTFYLHTGFLDWITLLPATTLGLFSTAVLNVNNMRDRLTDEAAGKNTLAVKMGAAGAKYYHIFLICGAWAAMLAFAFLSEFDIWGYAFMLVLPLSVTHLIQVLNREPSLLDPQLKLQSVTTFLFVLLFGIGVWMMG